MTLDINYNLSGWRRHTTAYNMIINSHICKITSYYLDIHCASTDGLSCWNYFSRDTLLCRGVMLFTHSASNDHIQTEFQAFCIQCYFSRGHTEKWQTSLNIRWLTVWRQSCSGFSFCHLRRDASHTVQCGSCRLWHILLWFGSVLQHDGYGKIKPVASQFRADCWCF